MKNQLIPIVALFLLLANSSTAADAKRVPTSRQAVADYYAWVTDLSIGPSEEIPPRDNFETTGRTYRIAVLTEEIYNTVFIEDSVGEDGFRQDRIDPEGRSRRLRSPLFIGQSDYWLSSTPLGVPNVVRVFSPCSQVFSLGATGATAMFTNNSTPTMRPVPVAVVMFRSRVNAPWTGTTAAAP